MWVKKSPQELKKDQIKTDWKVAKRTALILIGILVFASIFHTGEEAYKGESFLVSPEDIIGRFLSLAPPFLICAFAIYTFYWISVRIVPLPLAQIQFVFVQCVDQKRNSIKGLLVPAAATLKTSKP